MRDAMRALRFSIGLVARTGRWRALVWAGCMGLLQMVNLLSALLAREVADAIVAQNETRAVVFGVATALLLASIQVVLCLLLSFSPKVEEASLAKFDEMLVGTTLALPAYMHSSPPVQDRLEQLRQQRSAAFNLNYAALAFTFLSLNLITTVFLLGSFSLLLLLLPLFGLPLIYARGRQTKAFIALQQELAQDRRLALSLFRTSTSAGQASEVRIFGLGPAVVGRWQEIRLRADRRADDVGTRVSIPVAAAELFFGLGFIGALTLIVRQALRGQASVGDVLLLTALAGSLTRLLGGLAGIFGWLGTVMGTVQRYLWLRDRLAAHQAALTADGDLQPAPASLQSGISLRGVSHTYGGAAGPALSDIDLDLPAGATVALVGENGAGKSTLAAVLLGLLDPAEGQVLVDDVPLRAIDPAAWNGATSVVLQDHAKFELVTQETVGVGNVPHIDDRSLVQAAVGRAAAGTVIDDLPEGLDSALGSSYGQGGRELSGGQWQRLAVARGLMRETPLLLVMDEPTAALDAQAESELFSSYSAAARRAAGATGGITVLVSHRFSTVRSADLIVVLDQGKVIEQGDHATLMALGGLYAELYELQASGYR